jgi:hypothetical protein
MPKLLVPSDKSDSYRILLMNNDNLPAFHISQLLQGKLN